MEQGKHRDFEKIRKRFALNDENNLPIKYP